MADIELNWIAASLGADLRVVGGDLSTENELRTAVVISLFSWRRASDDDKLPDDTNNKQGWWGDSYPPAPNHKIGSKLWLLKREKLTQNTINRAIGYCKEALEWLISDGVASKVDITAERNGMDGLSVAILITRTNGTSLNLKFADAWENIQGGVNNG